MAGDLVYLVWFWWWINWTTSFGVEVEMDLDKSSEDSWSIHLPCSKNQLGHLGMTFLPAGQGCQIYWIYVLWRLLQAIYALMSRRVSYGSSLNLIYNTHILFTRLNTAYTALVVLEGFTPTYDFISVWGRWWKTCLNVHYMTLRCTITK